MQKFTAGLFFIGVILLLNTSSIGAGGRTESAPMGNSEVTAAQKSLARRSNDFGFELFRRMAATRVPDSNIMISPLSISYALAMTYNGAAGKTKSEIARTLRLPDMPDDVMNESYEGLFDRLTRDDASTVLEIANSLWYHDVGIKPTFADRMRSHFRAEVRNLNFRSPGATDTINAWVADRTHNHIPDIIEPPIRSGVVMFLINAVYFNGLWMRPFNPDRTYTAGFHTPGGSVIQCRMMHRSDTMQYVSHDLFQAVELPYGDGSFSMLLLLPNAETGIDDLIDQLTTETWGDWLEDLSAVYIDLHLPRFAFTDHHGLNGVLQAMGMVSPFGPADFSAMVEESVWIDTVIHKTFIKVNEEGTEAAAATAVVLKKMFMRNALVFDRPFLFAVRERESNAILFIGKVADPAFEE